MFKPKHVYIEADALAFKKGRELKKQFEEMGTTIEILSQNRVTNLLGKSPNEKFENGKQSLVIGVRRTMEFQSCKPTAHYEIPLVSGCIAKCEYCYLNGQLKDKPYTKLHVNTEEILKKAKKYIGQAKYTPTIFEGSTNCDPIPVEPYSQSLTKSIEFFAKEREGRFRFVTKFTDVDCLLNLKHNGHTTIFFSINTDTVITSYEHMTPCLKERIEAARKVIKAGYPVGFLIAPVFMYPHWKEDYLILIKRLKEYLPPEHVKHPITFEIISHRYTPTSKNHLLQIFDESDVALDEAERKYKYGDFGYGKYVYPAEVMQEMKELFEFGLSHLEFPYEIKYIM